MAGLSATLVAVRAHLLRAVGLALVVACLTALASLERTSIRVEWVTSGTAPGPGELFYAERWDFGPDRSRIFPTIADGHVHHYVVDIPTSSPNATLRLDPATGPGTITSRRLSMRWRVLGIPSRKVPLLMLDDGHNDVEILGRDRELVQILSRGLDPWVHLSLPVDASNRLITHRAAVASLAGLAAAGLWLGLAALVAAWGRAARLRSAINRMAGALRKLGAHASDRGGVRFGAAATGFLLACALGAAVGVAANINQSSVEMWNSFLPSASSPDSTLLGSARGIRSDEWLVFTPWMLSQTEQRLPTENESLGGKSTPLLTSLPVAHPVMWVQPEFWGFWLFSPERAIAWHWMFKTFGLLASAFVMLMLLTRNDTVTSALGATWLWLSSFTQWWFSAGIPEIFIGFCMTMCGMLYIAGAQRMRGLVGGAMLLIIGGCTFALQMYPPFQVPLAWVGIAIVAGTALDPRARAGFAVHARRRLAALLGAACVIVLVLAVYVVDAWPTVEAVLDTAYPGRRSTVGGGLAWRNLFDGIFELWRVGEHRFPTGGGNASEASDFVLLFPVAALLVASEWRRIREFPVIAALGIFCLFLALWAVVPLPASVAQAFAKITLMSYSPPGRSIAALGAASILLCCMVVARRGAMGTHRSPHRTALAVSVAVFVTLQFGALMLRADPGYMTVWRVLLGSTVVGLGTAALVTGRRRLLAAMVALIALPGLTVNPINYGLGPLLDKPVLKAAQSADDGGQWIAIGNITLPQALKAIGLKTFGGATYTPDLARMRVLDPSAAQEGVWNRYAHIQLESAPGITRPEFVLVQADHYIVRIDVCRDSPLLGINHLAYAGETPPADLDCLRPVSSGPIDGISLYKFDAASSAAGILVP